MKLLRELERRLEQRVRDSLRSGSDTHRLEAIEIQRLILEEVTQRASDLPRGRRALLSNEVTVRVVLPSPETRSTFEAVLSELETDLRDHLASERIEVPARLSVNVDLLDNPLDSGEPFELNLRKAELPEAQRPATSVAVLTVLEGQAEQPVYMLDAQRINLGRTREVLDREHRLIRRNDVAFTESDTTVSRTHAYIRYHPEAGVFRVYDDHSRFGTTVIRGGQSFRVPAGNPGLALVSGDEIHLGRARLRFDRSAT